MIDAEKDHPAAGQQHRPVPYQNSGATMRISSVFAVCLLTTAPLASHSQSASPSPLPARQTAALASKQSIADSYGQLPLSFEANQGQTAPQVRFLSHNQGYSLFLTESEAVLALTHHAPAIDSKGKTKPATAEAAKTDVIRMRLAGASPTARLTGADPLPGKVNYFLGKDPAKWRTNVPTYEKVKYTAVYPGVDLAYYGNQHQLEYDFILAPGASVKPIRVQFDGTGKVTLKANGDLNVSGKYGAVAFHKPVIYQMQNGQRQTINGSFQMVAKNTVGFRLGAYDHTRELVIDPVVAYSTYLGGKGNSSLPSGDSVISIAVDSTGHAFLAGSTTSPNFPVTGEALQKSSSAEFSGFVAMLNSAGTHLLYSTYFGGSSEFRFNQIAVDAADHAYVTGESYGSGFPTTAGAYQADANSSERAFISELNPTGSSLIFSALLGGSGETSGNALAVDATGAIYIGGDTASTDFPTTPDAYQATDPSGTFYTGFVTKLNATGTALIYSTYLGGPPVSGYIQGGVYSLVIDSSGDAYAAGAAFADFPVTPGAYATTPFPSTDGQYFVAKLNPAGSDLIYSTYFPGYGIAVDSEGSVYAFSNFEGPVTAGAISSSGWGWVGKLNPAGSKLVYGTYVGNNVDDNNGVLQAITVDNHGHAFIGGGAGGGFTVTSDAFQSSSNGYRLHGSFNLNNAIFGELSPDGTSMTYGTYIGGSGNGNFSAGDTVFGINLDAAGNVYIAGQAYSHNFPVTPGAIQTANRSPDSSNGFITKFAFNGATTTVLTTESLTYTAGANAMFTAVAASTSGGAVPTGTITFFVDGQTAAKLVVDGTGSAIFSTDTLAVGSHTIEASYDGEVPLSSASAATPLTVAITAAP
jgi:Bacterial Ig-like domain (group 3)/Beta-propeller repeat